MTYDNRQCIGDASASREYSMNTSIREYRSGASLIFHGDVLQVLDKKIRDGSMDLIFADPPYNIGKQFQAMKDRWPSVDAYLDWCASWLDLCILKLKPTGSMYVMASTQAMPRIELYLQSRLHVLSRIIWTYDSSGVQAKKKFGSMYEPILHCVKDPKYYTFNAGDIQVEARTGSRRRLVDYRKKEPTVYQSTKVPGNVWYFPRVRYRMPEYEKHPTQKPEALLKRIIMASSNQAETVLDPFAGTFTTCAVAHKTGRKSIGIELQDEYVRIGLERLRNNVG
jgi:adenine-specific DNA-methyltransferase